MVARKPSLSSWHRHLSMSAILVPSKSVYFVRFVVKTNDSYTITGRASWSELCVSVSVKWASPRPLSANQVLLCCCSSPIKNAACRAMHLAPVSPFLPLPVQECLFPSARKLPTLWSPHVCACETVFLFCTFFAKSGMICSHWDFVKVN